MASAGSFKLLTNDGKQDEMIMATQLLNTRLSKIQHYRSRMPRVRDPTPSLVDIEQTHELFVNAHFKPYVAIGYEYQTVQASRTQLGTQVIFSIPLYGDFIHDMVLHMTLGAVSATNSGAGNRLIRYCNYPGERICKKTEISVNGNVLDTYESDVMPFYREHYVQPNKQAGYDRNMGQQSRESGVAANSGGRGGGYVENSSVSRGAQTPLATQPALDLWVPIIFWFSLDVKLSLISVSIPHGQRFLKIDLASAAELLQHQGYSSLDDAPASNPVPVPDVNICELYINNIFVNPEIHNIIIKKIGFNLIRVYRIQRQIADKTTDRILLSQFKWPVETIYMGARPTANFATSSSLMVDCWDKHTSLTKTTYSSNQMHVNAYKWGTLANDPAQAADYTGNGTSTGLIRLDGKANINFATVLGVAGATVLTVTQINQALTRNGYLPLSGTFVNSSAPTNAEILAATGSMGAPIEWFASAPTIDTLGVEAHGIELFKLWPSKFYNSYLPFHYGENKVSTPRDSGKIMIPFNFYPGSYQPSGHVNVSRAREFYFKYESSTISANATAEMIFIGVAINFLLITDGSAVLRYST